MTESEMLILQGELEDEAYNRFRSARKGEAQVVRRLQGNRVLRCSWIPGCGPVWELTTTKVILGKDAVKLLV